MSGKASIMPSPVLTGYYYFNQYWNKRVNKHFIRLVGNRGSGGTAQTSNLWNGNLLSWSRPPCFCPQRDSHWDSWLDLNKRHRVGTSLSREGCEDRVRTDRQEKTFSVPLQGFYFKNSCSLGKHIHFMQVDSGNFVQQWERRGNIWKVWSL